jgi:hypothetical protein
MLTSWIHESHVGMSERGYSMPLNMIIGVTTAGTATYRERGRALEGGGEGCMDGSMRVNGRLLK